MGEPSVVFRQQGQQDEPSTEGGFNCAICKKRDSGATPDYIVGTQDGHDFHFACIKKIVDAGEPPKCPICGNDIGFTALLKRMEAIEAQRASPSSSQPQRQNVTLTLLGLHEKSRNRSLKFVVVGDVGVGKSCLLKRYVNGSYVEQDPTVGVDLMQKRILMNDEVVKLNLWDTAGAEQYRALVPNYFRNADVVLFMYSITDIQSFHNLASDWIPFYDEHGPKDSVCVIIGTKCDEEEKREVPKSLAKKFSKKEAMALFETSAKLSLNIEPAIRTAAAEALEKLLLSDDPDFAEFNNDNKVRLGDGKPKRKKLFKDFCN